MAPFAAGSLEGLKPQREGGLRWEGLGKRSDPAEEEHTCLEQQGGQGPRPLKHLHLQDKQAVDEFFEAMDELLAGCLEPGRVGDDGALLAAAARLLTADYLTPAKHLSFGQLLRAKIPHQLMIENLKLIVRNKREFLQEGKTDIVRQFADVLTEILVNPNNFDANSFVSRKNGKSLMMMITFMIRRYVQEHRVLQGLFGENFTQNHIRTLVTRSNLGSVETLLETTLDLIAQEYFKQSSRGEFYPLPGRSSKAGHEQSEGQQQDYRNPEASEKDRRHCLARVPATAEAGGVRVLRAVLPWQTRGPRVQPAGGYCLIT